MLAAAIRVQREDAPNRKIIVSETHNFPTGVAPFSGATTGTGGRIRDNQATGRGANVIAGTAGYCVGNLQVRPGLAGYFGSGLACGRTHVC